MPEKKDFRGFNGIRTRGLCVFFRAIFAIAQIAIHCDGHILISFVFPQFTSFHSVFHSFHGLMNSINWPASSVWVFIAQLGEHCSAKTQRQRVRIPLQPRKSFFGAIFAIA